MNQHATYFDCTVNATAGGHSVEYQSRSLRGVQVPAGAVGGLVGVTRWDHAAALWIFEAYKDQTLRRRTELDSNGRLGWTNARRPGGWTAPRELIPGAAGAFVDDETEKFIVRVPPEFFELADRYKVHVAKLLRAFVADAAGIAQAQDVPRADGYERTCEAGHRAALAYLKSAFGQAKEPVQHYAEPAEDDDCDVATIS